MDPGAYSGKAVCRERPSMSAPDTKLGMDNADMPDEAVSSGDPATHSTELPSHVEIHVNRASDHQESGKEAKSAAKPEPLKVNFDGIPESLQAFQLFVM